VTVQSQDAQSEPHRSGRSIFSRSSTVARSPMPQLNTAAPHCAAIRKVVQPAEPPPPKP
jgi:hypothetical protein